MIRLNDIVVKFGDFTALHGINVHVKEGEFFTFLGPSGCGKTTTLRTITASSSRRRAPLWSGPRYHRMSPSRTETSASCSRATRSSRR